ncbi:MAG: hypothetical protein RRY79_03180 [Clostridia bacterium]
MKRKTEREMEKSAKLKENIGIDKLRHSLPAMNMGDDSITDPLGSYIGIGEEGEFPIQDVDDL